MDKNTLDRANSLISGIKTLEDLNFVMSKPYPQFSCCDKSVNSACFDDKTLEDIKLLIKEFINKRRSELWEEFKLL